jgi:hypothetical protein
MRQPAVQRNDSSLFPRKKLFFDGKLRLTRQMFSHIVIFWTDPTIPDSADRLLAGMEKFLKPIPGILQFHSGRMVGSHRPVVDQSYQVALNLLFADRKAQDDYQVHPLHVEFVETIFKKTCKRLVIYDFE